MEHCGSCLNCQDYGYKHFGKYCETVFFVDRREEKEKDNRFEKYINYNVNKDKSRVNEKYMKCIYFFV